MSEVLNSPVRFPTVDNYQEWVRQDWVHPHGSDSAQLHTRAKFEEEIDELREAIIGTHPDDIELELGDVLWTAIGTSDNGSVTAAGALNFTYPDIFTDPIDIPTSGIDLAVAQNAHTFTTSRIDELLLDLKFELGKNAKQWHFLKPLLDEDDQRTFADAWIELKERRTKVALADTVLLTSYIAQTILGKSLEEVMITNHAKLSGRVAAGKPVTKPPK